MERAITFLGKDSGFGRKNTSAYAFVNNRLLLIDCGFTVFSQLMEQNLLNNVDGVDVIITHLHPDHCGSLTQVILYSYFILKRPVNVISACKKIDNRITDEGGPRFIPVPGFPPERYTRNNDFVTFIHTNHVGDIMDCYGFSATINGSHVVYTGDTATIQPFLKYLDKGTQFFVDTSISGETHLKLEDNLQTLKELTKKGVDVYLMHLDKEKEIRELIKDTEIHICDD